MERSIVMNIQPRTPMSSLAGPIFRALAKSDIWNGHSLPMPEDLSTQNPAFSRQADNDFSVKNRICCE